jgi:hypothetical protein
MLEIALLDLFVDLAHAGSSAAAPTSVSATQPTLWLPWGVEVLPIVVHGFRIVPTPLPSSLCFPQVQTATWRCGHQWCSSCLHLHSTLCHHSSDCCYGQVGIATGVVNGALLHPFNAIKYRCVLLLPRHHNAAFTILPAL